MRFTRSGWASIFAVGVAAATLVDCVSDEPATPGGGSGDDSGTDAQSQPDSGSSIDADAGSDSGGDSGSCAAPTSATPGQIDQTFATGFKNITNSFSPFAFTIDDVGRVYVVGQALQCVSASSGYDFAIVRFKPNGDIDNDLNPSNKPLCFDFGNGGEAAQTIAIDADKKIVVGGLGGTAGAYTAALVRIDDTGALDHTLNSGGKLAGIYAGGVALDSGLFTSINGIGFFGDKIVLVGADDSNPSNRTTGFVVRLNHDGSTDSGFGTMGVYKDGTNVGGFSKVAVGTDGSVAVVGGYGAQIQTNFVVERLNAVGARDTSFATGGIFAPGPLHGAGPDVSHQIELLANGDYAVSGGVNAADSVSGTAAIAMLDTRGKLDNAFGASGVFVAPTSVFYDSLTLDRPLASLCGGDFFYVGRQNDPDGGAARDIALMHVLKNGTLDNAFGTAGIGVAHQSIGNVIAVAIDPASQKPTTIASQPATNALGMFRFNP